MNIRTFINALAAAGLLFTTGVHAAYTETGMPAIQNGFPVSMAAWMGLPDNFTWNPVNARRGFHPDRPDLNSLDPANPDPGVVYIFPDAASANAWWNGLSPATPPAGIPDDAVAYIHWALDNKSGMFPGIMAISDDDGIYSNNCIMAAGFRIPTELDPALTEAKTCGNYRGSSKRFKMVVLKADVPIDLVFNMTNTTFENRDAMHDPTDPTDLEYLHWEQVDVQDDIFRIYRYMIKWGNGTGTDSATEDRTGTRLVGFKAELGYGLGPNPGDFTATTNDDSDGLAFDLRDCVDDKYFDVDPSFPTGADGACLAATVEIYQPDEFATFSPSMYSNTDDNRTGPIGGYWDKNPAGIYPPQIAPNATYTNILEVGVGDTTANYFDVGANQASSASQIPDNMFGYMMYYGVFADNDPGNISMGIYKDDDGDPTTEGSLYAWWDGNGFRWGIDADMDGNSGGTIPDPNAWGSLTADELAEIASRPLAEDQVLDPPRYEFGYMDDLGGLNADLHIKITPDYNVTTNSTFTVRFTAQSTADAGLASNAPGVANAAWKDNPMPAAADFFDDLPTTPTTPPATGGGDSGGLCSYNPEGRFDPLLPGLILAALAYLGWRLKKKKAK